MEFSLSGAGSPGSERRSGDGLDTRAKNKGTAGGGIWDTPLAREGDSSSMFNPHVPAETG